MDGWGMVLVVAGAVVLGLVIDAAGMYIADAKRFGYDAIIPMIGAAVGGFVASEYFGRLSDWGTQSFGVRILPALIGALVLGTLAEVALRYLEQRGGSPAAHA